MNRQGHEAFGYYFSLSNALFVASLWPVPIVLAWMKLRFGLISPELPFSLPLFGNQPSMSAMVNSSSFSNRWSKADPSAGVSSCV